MIKLVNVTVRPSNAIAEVKALARVQLNARGGDGCVWELLEWINKNRETNGNG